MMRIVGIVLCLVLAAAFLCSGAGWCEIHPDGCMTTTAEETDLDLDTHDLVIDDIYWVDVYGTPASLMPTLTSGQQFSVCASIRNSGGYDSVPFHVRLLIDGESAGYDSEIRALNAEETYTAVWPGLLTSDARSHYVSVIVDVLDEVAEYNPYGSAEDNNLATESYEVRLAKWTFAVYMDADNNLEPYGVSDFLEMSSVGSSEDLSIVVQMDRAQGYSADYGDWTDTARFLITEGMTPLEELAYERMGEVNMAESGSLQDFVEHSFTTFRAENTCLVLWDHGTSWIGGCCRDEASSNDSLTTVEIRDAMLSAKPSVGDMIDIVGIDCCLMGSLEICYLFRDIALNFVGSEAGIPLEGWPYDRILRALYQNNAMTPEELSSAIVEEYALSYEDTSWFVTLGAFRVDVVSNEVVGALDGLAQAIMSSGSKSTWSRVEAARGATIDFDPILTDPSFNDCLHADVYRFAYEVARRVSDQAVLDAAIELMVAIDAAKIASSVHSIYKPYYDAYGIMVFWPDQDIYLDEYASQDISLNTSWDEFLNAFYDRQ